METAPHSPAAARRVIIALSTLAWAAVGFRLIWFMLGLANGTITAGQGLGIFLTGCVVLMSLGFLLSFRTWSGKFPMWGHVPSIAAAAICFVMLLPWD